MKVDKNAIGSDIARSRRQYFARLIVDKIIRAFRLNSPSLFKTEFYQRWSPECFIPTKIGKIKMVAGHGRLVWRAQTFYTEEPQTVDWLDKLKSSDVLWDIGANVGIYSLYAAGVRRCRVVAFEPEPNNFSILMQNVCLNNLYKKIMLCNCPVSSKNMPSTFQISLLTKGGAFNKFTENKYKIRKSSKIQIQSFGFSLDNLIKSKLFPKPTHIKIDVDGNEDKILSGAKVALQDKSLRSLLIEMEEKNKEHQKSLRLLSKSGFKIEKKRSNWESRKNKKNMLLSPGVNYIFSRY